MRCSARFCSPILVFARLHWPIKAALIVADKRLLRREFLCALARAARLVVDRSAAAAFQAPGRAHRRAAFACGRHGRDLLWVEESRQGQFSERRPARLPPALQRQTCGADGGGGQGERRREASGRPDRGFRRGQAAARPTHSARSDAHLRSPRPAAAIPRPAARSIRPRARATAPASSSRRSRLRACRPKTHSKKTAEPCLAGSGGEAARRHRLKNLFEVRLVSGSRVL